MASPPSKVKVSHPPHFFKIILHTTLEDKKLMLPKKFITDYGKFISNSICLKLPDGLEWKLGSKTANDTVWLQNGWQQFSNHYRLKPGSLLVFRFDGNSTFQTCIFDQTCLEIQYPSNNIGKTKPDNEKFNGYQYEEVETNNHEINDLEPEKIGFKILVKKSTVEGRYNMLIPKRFASKHLKEEFGRIEIENSDGENWAMSYKWSQSRNVAEYVYISRTTFSPPISAKNTNVEITTPNNNLFFKVNIHKKSYKNSVLNIPLTFAENHLSSKVNIAKLIVGKKQWKVNISKKT
ncbi:unnamed protein product [Citrullus colocynthis]|uniref:TF-B3 domain-containing protein n=1 Tax=Citrullus colocynthis TaxID=252529 RepID=A0ABP0YIM4_9ROSI